MFWRCVILLLACPGAIWAQVPAMVSCSGQNPEWTFEIDAGTGTLDFLLDTHMELMLSTAAEGRDNPVALTFVGARDTAIVILHRRACGSAPYEAQVLTQRGQTPILLTGCCEAHP